MFSIQTLDFHCFQIKPRIFGGPTPKLLASPVLQLPVDVNRGFELLPWQKAPPPFWANSDPHHCFIEPCQQYKELYKLSN